MWSEFWPQKKNKNTHKTSWMPFKYGLPADFQKECEPSQWVWTMFVQALENSCRTDGGYTGIRDVYQVAERISSALLFKRFLLQGWWKQGWCATVVLPGGDPQVPLPALQWRAYHQHGPVGLQHRGGSVQLDNGYWSTTDCRHILYLSEEWTLSIDHILSFRVILNFLSGWLFPSSHHGTRLKMKHIWRRWTDCYSSPLFHAKVLLHNSLHNMIWIFLKISFRWYPISILAETNIKRHPGRPSCCVFRWTDNRRTHQQILWYLNKWWTTASRQTCAAQNFQIKCFFSRCKNEIWFFHTWKQERKLVLEAWETESGLGWSHLAL